MTFIYGEHDWMNPQTGKDCCAAIEATRGKLNPDDLKVGINILARGQTTTRTVGLYVYANRLDSCARLHVPNRQAAEPGHPDTILVNC